MAKLLSAPTKNGIQKTLAAELLSTATTGDAITFADVDGIPNLPGVLVVDRIDSAGTATPSKREYIEYSGTSGVTVLITTRNVDGGGTTQTHAVGAIVEFMPDVVWADRIYDSLSNIVNINDVSALASGITLSAPSLLNSKIVLGTGNINSSGATISAILDEDTLASNRADALATQQSIKAYVDTINSAGGWIASGETWTYAAADDPTFTFTIAGVDLTTKYSAGMRIKLTQTTVKYFIITAVAFSTDTTITVYGGTDYDLANAAITSPFYSREKAPVGFPLDHAKWEVLVTDTSSRTQASPTQNQWYNLGTTACQISVPIGAWKVGYKVFVNPYEAADTAVAQHSTLSTANNSESDPDFTGQYEWSGPTGALVTGSTIYVEKNLVAASKTVYYLNSKTKNSGQNNITFANDQVRMLIRAVSNYL